VIESEARFIVSPEHIKEVIITPYNCKQLMIEAALLLKELHNLGVRLNCSITNFIQVCAGKNGLTMRIVGVRTSSTYDKMDIK